MDHERALSWFLVFVIVGSLLGIIYFSVTPHQSGPQYTEFYVLGPDGNASDYPTNLSVGETGRITLGITNHEGRQMDYTVVVQLGNNTSSTQRLSLEADETREWEVTFTPTDPGTYELKLLLYTGPTQEGTESPYRRLRLWVEVRP